MNKQDSRIKKKLVEETDHVKGLKEKAWENIHQELFQEQLIKKRRRTKLVTIVSVAAMLLLIWTGLSTTTGQALMQEIKDLFADEKDVELNIEGQEEEIHVELETNETLRYVIYIDTSNYKLVKTETKDIITPEPALGSNYPEVYMEISKKENTKRENELIAIKKELTANDMIIQREENVTTPIAGTVIQAVKGDLKKGEIDFEWDTPVIDYYVTEETKEQFFIIKQKYFMEASEGHGVRFDSMLESFEVVSERE